ncbi:ABC transporter substrate-binding protein [Streptomyces sp. NPDC057438]|uniref:ABC transporter substrate-binding protein n=1 Tax=Streptomyces sp. NPDC057438 TaxID=3346133 RepID=UPI0036A3D429
MARTWPLRIRRWLPGRRPRRGRLRLVAPHLHGAGAGPLREGVKHRVRDGHPAARGFSEAYEARYGERPGWYAAEAYDAVLFLAEACVSGGAVLTERGAIVRRMREVTYKGVSRTVAHTADP